MTDRTKRRTRKSEPARAPGSKRKSSGAGLEDVLRATRNYGNEITDLLVTMMEAMSQQSSKPLSEDQVALMKEIRSEPMMAFLLGLEFGPAARAFKEILEVHKRWGVPSLHLVNILRQVGDLEFLVGKSVADEIGFDKMIRAVDTADKVGALLEKDGWPFDDAPGMEEHVLTRKNVEPAVTAARGIKQLLVDMRGVVKRFNRDSNIKKPPSSKNFQKVPAVRAVARDLYDCLARAAFRAELGNDDKELTIDEVNGSLGKVAKGRLMQDACDIVNAAFPTIADLNPALVRASYPKP